MILLVGSNPSDIFLYYGPVSSLPLLEPFTKSEFSHPLCSNFYNPDFAPRVLLRDEMKAVPSVLCKGHLQQCL